VVGPCWVAEVDGGVAGVESGQEEAAQVNGTRPGDGLDGVCALLSEGRRVCSQYQLRGC
jgi:hypothetical protein